MASKESGKSTKAKKRGRKSSAVTLTLSIFEEEVRTSGHWNMQICHGLTSGKVSAFVYQVTNQTNNRKYIGYKTLIKGWQTYCTSSKYITAAIKEDGIENFTFDVIQTCETNGRARASEMWWQITLDVLSDEYYNMRQDLKV